MTEKVTSSPLEGAVRRALEGWWENDEEGADDLLRRLCEEIEPEATAKLSAIREIAAGPVNRFETPEMRLAMIVRLIDVGQVSPDAERE